MTLICIQFGKMNKRQAVCPVTCHNWEAPSEGENTTEVPFCPMNPPGNRSPSRGTLEELLSPPGDNMSAVFTNLRMFPRPCCRCPQSRENQGWPSRVLGFQQEFKPQLSKPFIHDNIFFNETKLCWFFILIQKNSTFKRFLLHRQTMFLSVSPPQTTVT